jgi:hypothetical protein
MLIAKKLPEKKAIIVHKPSRAEKKTLVHYINIANPTEEPITVELYIATNDEELQTILANPEVAKDLGRVLLPKTVIAPADLLGFPAQLYLEQNDAIIGYADKEGISIVLSVTRTLY